VAEPEALELNQFAINASILILLGSNDAH